MKKTTLAAAVSEANNVMPLGADIANARHTVVDTLRAGYGAHRAYAEMLNEALTIDWFDQKVKTDDPEVKLLFAEKAELYSELKAIEHTNPSVIWARICNYGREERFGPVEKSGDAKTDGGRAPDVRIIEETSKLYKFIAKLEEPTKAQSFAMSAYADILNAYGVSVESLA